MTNSQIAGVLALFAALASAIGNVVRQRSAQEITDEEVGHLALFWLSLRDVRWWLGGGGALANYILQTAALALGSVMLVTGLQVTALLFALPIYAHVMRSRVTRWEWTWAALLAGSLAVVIAVGDPDAGVSRGSLATWLVVALVMGPIMVLCVLAARIWQGSVAAVLLAVVAGCSLALFAVLTKAVVELVDDGAGALFRALEFYAWIVAALGGMIFQQSSFRAGSLTASLPTSVVAKPLIGGMLGMVVLGETFDTTRPGRVVVALAVVLMVVATVALARGEAEMVAEESADGGCGPRDGGHHLASAAEGPGFDSADEQDRPGSSKGNAGRSASSHGAASNR
ncbi:DMT family transporter [Mycobacterium sp.]|uniref:DMT family transporter n=1 Tax=Mycobacterium sp. TaxID=1785 RepID=UPI003BA9EBFD